MRKLLRKVIKSEEIHRGKTYIFDNFPHFLITFLAALPPCRHCFHRTDNFIGRGGLALWGHDFRLHFLFFCNSKDFHALILESKILIVIVIKQDNDTNTATMDD